VPITARPALTRREAIARARRSPKFRRWVPQQIAYFAPDPALLAEEKHHTPADVAKLWALSVETVRRLLENEPGVLKMTNAAGYTGRRRYKTLRIPASVVARVHRRISA
jgi:hypothetical protein